MSGNHVPSDAVQPGGRGPAIGALSMAALDRLDENVRGEISRVLGADDPTSDEPFDLLDVRSVERVECIRIVTDVGDVRGYVHTYS